jgi:hypothetical protein
MEPLAEKNFSGWQNEKNNEGKQKQNFVGPKENRGEGKH